MLVIDVSSILEFLLTVVPVVDDKVDDETEDINVGPAGDVASVLKNETKNLRKITLSLIVILY